MKGHAEEGRRTPSFVVVNVVLVPQEDLVPTLAVRRQGQQIRHRARRREHASFFSEEPSHCLLQTLHSFVLVVTDVTYLGIIHGFAHPVAWTREGVGAKLNCTVHKD